MRRRSYGGVGPRRLTVVSGELDAFRHFTAQKRLPMRLVAQIHLEMCPRPLLQYSHPPRASHPLGELPQNVIAVFIREAFQIRLNDTPALVPDRALASTKN